MKESPEEPAEGVASLGWGKEDRVRLVEAKAPGAREAIELRVEDGEAGGIAAWLAERDLIPVKVLAFEGDAAEMRDAWPDAELLLDRDPAGSNRFVVSIEAPADVRVDLHVPFPAGTVVERGRHGPFYRRSKGWSGLENPGLLGVTLGAGDPRALEGFLEMLGMSRMTEAAEDRSAGEDPPFLAGDHQLRIERREPPGIYGAAYVVAAARLPDLLRTLERFGAQHRLDRNHLLAVDPAGRVLAVNGVRTA
jgi:hypothetical protein